MQCVQYGAVWCSMVQYHRDTKAQEGHVSHPTHHMVWQFVFITQETCLGGSTTTTGINKC